MLISIKLSLLSIHYPIKKPPKEFNSLVPFNTASPIMTRTLIASPTEQGKITILLVPTDHLSPKLVKTLVISSRRIVFCCN